MRKLVTILSVLLLAVALIGPYVIGRKVETIMVQSRTELAASLPQWAELVSMDYHRGWFGARSRYRVLISESAPPGLLQLLGQAGGFGDQPALLIDNAIKHGPVTGLLTPALLAADSRFAIDAGAQNLTPLPALVSTRVGLTGSLRVDWAVAGFGLQQPTGEMVLGESTGRLQIAADQQHFDIAASLDSLSLSQREQTVAQLSGLELDADLELEPSTTAVSTRYRYQDLGDTEAPVTGSGEIAIRNIANDALPGLAGVIAASRERATGIALADLIDENLPVFVALLSDTPEIDWRHLEKGPYGDTNSALSVILSPQQAPAGHREFLDQLLIDARATFTFSAPVERVESEKDTGSAMMAMRASGILDKDRDAGEYRALVEYAEGTAMVNGIPVPVVPPK